MASLLLLPKREQPEVLAKWAVHLVAGPQDVDRWNREVSEKHYLKNAHLVGEQLRCAVTYPGEWLALLGWMAACYRLKDREQWLRWSKSQRRALRCWIHPRTREYEVPSETTFFHAMALVTLEQIQAALEPWLDQKLGPVAETELVAIDGKTLNHAGMHWVSAVAVPSLRCLGVEAVADKSNEIPALRTLAARLDLDGRLVEMDALHTQDETVQQLLMKRGRTASSRSKPINPPS